jgi:paraquat-inducible protein B
MRTFGFICLTIVVVIVLIVFGWFMKGCNTAERMADQTIFSAEKNITSYEQFYAKYNQYQQYRSQLNDASKEIEKLEASGDKTSQRYANLVTEADGVRNLMRRLAADYNTASQVSYQKIWKGKGLPERLGD